MWSCQGRTACGKNRAQVLYQQTLSVNNAQLGVASDLPVWVRANTADIFKIDFYNNGKCCWYDSGFSDGLLGRFCQAGSRVERLGRRQTAKNPKATELMREHVSAREEEGPRRLAKAPYVEFLYWSSLTHALFICSHQFYGHSFRTGMCFSSWTSPALLLLSFMQSRIKWNTTFKSERRSLHWEFVDCAGPGCHHG